MDLFRKLQENSLYWRYRFITRRYLAVKRWWRELRQPRQRIRVMRPTPRGMASFDPYGLRRQASGGVNAVRGMSFVVVIALAWTVLSFATFSVLGLPMGFVQVAVLLIVAYVYTRFW
jgi:hypothetical protein